MKQSYTKEQRYRVTQQVTLVGSAVNVVLAVAQLFGGLITQSQALIADGFHTLSDLVTDIVVLIAAKMASKAPDDDHPYGHERIETIATVVLGLALAGVAMGIALDASQRLLNQESLLQPSGLAIVLAVFGILCKEGLYRYTLHAGTKVNSGLLKANAQHHRSDAVSSLVVAIGVTASVIFSIPWLDALAAIIVASLIFYMGAKLILDSVMELVDTAWDSDKVDAMMLTISAIPCVKSVHMLRSRKMSNNILIDVHVQVSPYISVSEGHYIAEEVMAKIHEEFDEVSDIVVHIDPENDIAAALSNNLPNREHISTQLKPIVESVGLQYLPNNLLLHYLEGAIEAELSFENEPTPQQIKKITEAGQNIPHLSSISIKHILA